MSVSVEKFILGPIETNAYLVINESKKCLCIDPSSNCDELLQEIRIQNLELEVIILTHGHFDHIMGVPEIKEQYPLVPLYTHPNELELLKDPQFNGSFLIGVTFTIKDHVNEINEGNIEIGSFSCQIFSVPGHSPGGIAIKIEQYLFCGDILFAGSVGRTDLIGGNEQQLLDGIRKKLLVLPDETIVCPGHGGRTTIGREKKMNPYL